MIDFLSYFGPNGGGRARGNARNRRRGTNPRATLFQRVVRTVRNAAGRIRQRIQTPAR